MDSLPPWPVVQALLLSVVSRLSGQKGLEVVPKEEF